MRGTSDRSHPIALNLILVCLILRTVKIQMIDPTASMMWLGVSDEDDGGGGLKRDRAGEMIRHLPERR